MVFGKAIKKHDKMKKCDEICVNFKLMYVEIHWRLETQEYNLFEEILENLQLIREDYITIKMAKFLKSI